ALLFVERLKHDYDNCAAPLRQAVKYTQALRLRQACGAFLHYFRELQKIAPPDEFENARVELTN
ncbi:unnamed protein product, partial [Durusdinium trenchii]